MKTCSNCGKIFKPSQNRERKNYYCSRDCFNAGVRVERVKKACEVCGKKIEFRAKEKKKCCSKACAIILSGQTQKGRKQTSPAFYAASRAIYGARKHPKTGRFETHWHALEWYLRSPAGEEVIARNLRLYMINRYGEKEGGKIASGLASAAKRYRRNGHAQSYGWRILAEPVKPEQA